MRFRTTLGIGALLALCAGCAGHAAEDAARAAFERFQDRLLAGDAGGVRQLVTEESAPAVAALPLQQLARRQRLTVVAVADERGCYHVRVRDPNDGGAFGTYVVVRENGRMVVDLVATAGLNTRAIGPERRGYEIAPLGPADHDRLRAEELALPPGAPARQGGRGNSSPGVAAAR